MRYFYEVGKYSCYQHFEVIMFFINLRMQNGCLLSQLIDFVYNIKAKFNLNQ